VSNRKPNSSNSCSRKKKIASGTPGRVSALCPYYSWHDCSARPQRPKMISPRSWACGGELFIGARRERHGGGVLTVIRGCVLDLARGYAPTLEAAMADFRKAWELRRSEVPASLTALGSPAVCQHCQLVTSMMSAGCSALAR
jgi:hypothetical protein